MIRHAETGDDAPRDGERALTLRGRGDARRMGRALARRGIGLDLLISSPLVRAVQTAEIVAAAVDYRARVEVSELLIPEAAASRVLGLLKALGNPVGRDGWENRSIALVAHEPILSAVAAALTRQPHHPPLHKAEALRIRVADDLGTAGILRWRVDGRGRRERL
ncbi:MAG TPA: histidine phosphatase family protein [Polyangia bacterium]|nr:histidine phosphatase family protein [Polyangia bacterium]